MSGYRQSSYDPEAYVQPGRPLTPYNWVQWTGVALGTVGIGLFAVYLAGRFGWIAPIVEESSAGFIPTIVGAVLINSRREPSSLVTAEQRARNRRMLVITLIAVAVMLGGAALIQFVTE